MAKPFTKLRARFLEEDIDQKSIAALIHIDPSTLSKKLMGYSPFTSDEMYMICDVLNIKDNELHIFFPRRQQEAKSARKYVRK